MERVLSWLNQPLFPDTVIRVWMAVAAGAALLLALILAFFLIRRKKKKKRGDQAVEEPITERPEPLPELELANLQGVGSREEQQDAFGISRMDRYEEDGLLAVLCDGMGGMAEGGMIAAETVSELVGIFSWADDSDVPGWVYQRSARVYQQFRGHGGTTLVAALLKGDSSLFLVRRRQRSVPAPGRQTLWAEIRQEYKNELILRALDGRSPWRKRFKIPRQGALSEYIGKEEVNATIPVCPFPSSRRTLLLCSDGVSDTLTLKQIREAMALPPRRAATSWKRRSWPPESRVRITIRQSH